MHIKYIKLTEVSLVTDEKNEHELLLHHNEQRQPNMQPNAFQMLHDFNVFILIISRCINGVD